MTDLDSARDRSTYAITVAFTDEDGNAVTPTSATWSLVDENDDIVNERQNVVISSLDTSVTVVLSGADTAYANGAYRKFVVKYIYTSSLGAGQTNNQQVTFNVDDIADVT